MYVCGVVLDDHDGAAWASRTFLIVTIDIIVTIKKVREGERCV